jgi:hypothetical protein
MSETPRQTRYETRWVLAGAYPVSASASLLTHTLDTRVGAPLCGRVRPESLADAGANDPGEGEAQPTCKTCLRRDPRFKEQAHAR